MDCSGLVIYVGTFSKVLFPGLRLGWITAPRICIEALTAFRSAGDLGGALRQGKRMYQSCLRYPLALRFVEMHYGI